MSKLPTSAPSLAPGHRKPAAAQVLPVDVEAYIVDVVAEALSLTGGAGRYRCPFCAGPESTDFALRLDGRSFRCDDCGCHGDLTSLVARVRRVSATEATRWLRPYGKTRGTTPYPPDLQEFLRAQLSAVETFYRVVHNLERLKLRNRQLLLFRRQRQALPVFLTGPLYEIAVDSLHDAVQTAYVRVIAADGMARWHPERQKPAPPDDDATLEKKLIFWLMRVAEQELARHILACSKAGELDFEPSSSPDEAASAYVLSSLAQRYPRALIGSISPAPKRQTAMRLGVSPETLSRDITAAKRWLRGKN